MLRMWFNFENRDFVYKLNTWVVFLHFHFCYMRLLVYTEPMYRGPSKDPCIGTIYPTLLGFGGIRAIIFSYSLAAFCTLYKLILFEMVTEIGACVHTE